MAKKDVVEEVAVEEVAVEEVAVEEVAVVEATVKDHRMKLVHPDGRIAYAHESMIPAYLSGGFREEG